MKYQIMVVAICGIYCTTKKLKNLVLIMIQRDAISTHSRGLTKDECQDLLKAK